MASTLLRTSLALVSTVVFAACSGGGGGDDGFIPMPSPTPTPSGGPDMTPDGTPDVTPDVTPDGTPDVTPDVTPDMTPDPGDTTDPTVRILEPEADSTVSGMVRILVEASDDVGVTAVDILVNDMPLALLDTAPFETTWDTSAFPEGEVQIRALARDAAGNQGEATVSVQRVLSCDEGGDCPPDPVRFLNPEAGADVCGVIDVIIEAADDEGVADVELLLDGQSLGIDEDAPYEFEWDTTGADDGAHTLRAVARDTADQRSDATIEITVGNEGVDCDNPPTVVIVEPADGTGVRGRTPVRVDADDDFGVTEVEIFVDGTLAATFDQPPYQLDWDTDALPEGEHSLRATAKDTAEQLREVVHTVFIDRTPPSISITEPTAGSVVGDVFDFVVSPTDNTGISEVRFLVPGLETEVRRREPWRYAVDASTVTSGAAELEAEAIDLAGNSARTRIAVIFDRAPDVVINAPAPGARLEGIAVIDTSFSDDVGLSTLRWLVDDRIVDERPGQGRESNDVELQLDTTGLEFGSHVIRAEAEDARGQTGSAEITVTVDQPLTVGIFLCAEEICEPARPGQIVSGVLQLRASVRDDNGEIDLVTFSIDGEPLATLDAAPYDLDLDTTTLEDGLIELTVTADSSLDISESASVMLSVSNCDRDGDGDPTPACGGGDCNDDDDSIRSDAADTVGDGIDDNCDGADGVDTDGDGHASEGSGGDDCDDDDPTRAPSRSDQVGNGTDENCDGEDGVDADGDGTASVASGGDDCDDLTPDIRVGGQDFLGDLIDGDCDGVDGQDSDGDGFDGPCPAIDGDPVNATLTRVNPSSGPFDHTAGFERRTFASMAPGARVTRVAGEFTLGHGDLSELRISLRSPAGTDIVLLEAGAGRGDGQITRNFLSEGFDGEQAGGNWSLVIEDTVDGTGGGFFFSWRLSVSYEGHVRCDCAPDNADRGPGAEDSVGDGVDQNCDAIDGVDEDRDGFASEQSGGDDCDDTRAVVNPEASDVFGDGVDANCDGTDGEDVDGDGELAVGAGGADCNDNNDQIFPGAEDSVGDGVDQNCDRVDGVDADGDRAASEESGGDDCDDDDRTVAPGADDPFGDSLDTNCDGTDGVDGDGDGHPIECTPPAMSSTFAEDTEGMPLPDEVDATRTLEIIPAAPNATVTAVEVHWVIEHTWWGDLQIDICHPTAGCETLRNTEGGQGTVNLEETRNSFEFLGELAAGEWQLHIIDHASRDSGTLISWDLTVSWEADVESLICDCQDDNPSVFPGAPDPIGDGIDADCDGSDGQDADGDGHTSEASGGDDCDDNDPTVFLGATDTFGDGVDQNCDGADGVDQDGDGVANEASGGIDCNDGDPNIFGGAPDNVGDNVDQNCDGADGVDRDGDDHADEPSGGDDCNDNDPSIYLGATDEHGDGIDQDCDFADGIDLDQDGFGGNCDPGVGSGTLIGTLAGPVPVPDFDFVESDRTLTGAPAGAEVNQVVLDYQVSGDNHGGIVVTLCHEGICREVWDQEGSGNSGLIDETFTFFETFDGTDPNGVWTLSVESVFPLGSNVVLESWQVSIQYAGALRNPTCDCDDLLPGVNPGEPDPFGDGMDTDCDGVDGTDQDGDGVRTPATGGDDCDDGNASVFPGAPDPCGDGLDTNCDNLDGVDADGDGFASVASGCGDCEDGNPAIFPTQTDNVGDGVDNNCDGIDGVDFDQDAFASVASGGPDCDDDNDFINPDAEDRVGNSCDDPTLTWRTLMRRDSLDGAWQHNMLFDAAGTRHMVWTDEFGLARHGWQVPGGSLQTAPLHSNAVLGIVPAMAEGPAGQMHFVWQDEDSGELFYARGAASSYEVESLGIEELVDSTSIAVSDRGIVHIVYETDGSAHHITNAVGRWASRQINVDGQRPFVTTDWEEVAHILYGSASGALRYSSFDRGEITDMPAAGGSANVPGGIAVRQVDGVKEVIIAFSDNNTREVQISTRAGSGDWSRRTLQTVLSGRSVDTLTLTLDRDDTPWVGYVTRIPSTFGGTTWTLDVVHGAPTPVNYPIVGDNVLLAWVSLAVSETGVPYAVVTEVDRVELDFYVADPACNGEFGDPADEDCDGLDGVDGDDDGFASLASGGDDCDDTLSSVNPDADDDVAGGVDNNCDGVPGVDFDGDGFASTSSGGTDCDDVDHTVHPGAMDFVEGYCFGDRVMLEVVDDSGQPGQYANLVRDGSGNLHVSWYESQLRNLRYANDSSGDWFPANVDFQDDVGRHAAMGLAPDGSLRIAYQDTTAGTLELADNSSGSWQVTTLATDPAGSVADGVDLVVDDSGVTHIVFADEAGEAVSYMSDATGTFVEEEVFDSESNHVAIALGASQPIVLFHDISTSTVRAADRSANGSWNVVAVGPAGAYGTRGRSLDLLVGSNGTVFAAYRNAADGALMYASRDGQSWDVQTLDSIGDPADSLSMAVDSENRVAIAQVDAETGRLVVLSNAGITSELGFKRVELDLLPAAEGADEIFSPAILFDEGQPNEWLVAYRYFDFPDVSELRLARVRCIEADEPVADRNCDGVDGIDEDGDGFASIESGGDDCHDARAEINPGAGNCDDACATVCDRRPDPFCEGDTAVSHDSVGTCAGTECSFGQNRTDCTTQGLACIDGGCAAPDIAPGDLVITEIMPNPAAVTDANGEWFEVYNPGASSVNMAGLTIRDENDNVFTVTSPALLAAGDYFVFGRSTDNGTNGGASVDQAWSDGFRLTNDNDVIEIRSGDTVIDRVAYSSSFPLNEGVAMSLSSNRLEADDNDSAFAWCDAVDAYGSGDLGTPGAENPACANVCGGTLEENFEGGSLGSEVGAPFVDGGGTRPWEYGDSVPPGGGSRSVRNRDIADNQSARMRLVVSIDSGGGEVTFDYRVSSESNFDYLRFYIDGSQQDRWSGNVSWSQAAYNLSAGQHTLEWRYTKDTSVSNGSDAAWVDNVVVTNINTCP